MSDNQFTRNQGRESRSMGEEESAESSGGMSFAPPRFSLSANPAEDPPSDGRGAALQLQSDESSVIQRDTGSEVCSAETGADRVICDLRALGVDEDEFGLPSALTEVASWTDYAIVHELLKRVNEGGGRFGARGRLVRAWNNHLDDLGITAGGRGPEPGTPYASLFHYGRELNRLSRTSMGVASYTEAIREENMPTVRLAGVTVGVHYRAVYLAAAAQVGMDERGRDGADGERSGGEGHYVPVGGFQPMVRDIQGMLRMLAFSDHGRRARARRSRSEGLAHGPQALQTMHGELLRMLATLQRQAAAMAAGEDIGEHIEPGVSDYFMRIADRLQAYHPATSPEEVPTSAQALLAIVSDGLPGNGDTHHGYGSVDPHGTDHAMGLAVDIYNGRGREGTFQNFGIREEYWPFVHHLIRHAGSTLQHLDANLAPDAVHELEPEAARELARLLASETARQMGQQFHDRAVEMRRRRRGDVTEEEAERQRHDAGVLRNTRTMYAGIRGRAHRALRERIQIFNQLRSAGLRRVFSEGSGGVQDEIVILFNELRELNGTVEELSPAQLEARLRQLQTRLQQFQTRAAAEIAAAAAAQNEEMTEQERTLSGMGGRDRRRTMATMSRGDRNRMTTRLRGLDASRTRRDRVSGLVTSAYHESDTLSGLTTDIANGRSILSDEELAGLDETSPITTRGEGRDEVMDLDQAFGQQTEAAILEFAGTGAFLRWLEFVRRRPIYDQSEVMVAGFDSVRAFDGAERTHDHTHFYGGHHWTVAPRDELLGSEAGYRNVILRDMHDRPAGQIERILQIMAESAGGRGVLFGGGEGGPDTDFSGGDAEFRAVLNQVVTPQGAAEMLNRVHTRLVERYQALEGDDGALMGMMRDRGFYLLDEAGDGEGISYAVSEGEHAHHAH